MGVDKKQWAKVILRSPGLLTHSRQKLQAIVNFLNEVGLSGDSIGIHRGRSEVHGVNISICIFLQLDGELDTEIGVLFYHGLFKVGAGVKIGLNRMLAVSFCDFEKVLETSRKNMLADELSSCPESK
ncbi:hypothetical protein Pint_26846 [Pistacia integerrima]|uniref:Uncharacterized protein n=1 Tax=Pistacia integerrima TaxID=434235 RepID=A0ACC0YQY0_9ROSI|nr:hypothetical protein Pint_26846 [Pistacia integerrima]